MRIYFVVEPNKSFDYNKEYSLKNLVFFYEISTPFTLIKKFFDPEDKKENPFVGYKVFCGEMKGVEYSNNKIVYKVSGIKEMSNVEFQNKKVSYFENLGTE